MCFGNDGCVGAECCACLEALQERFKESAPDRLDALMEMHAFWIDYSKRYCRLLSDDKSVWAHCQMRLQLMYLDELNRLKDD